MNQTTYDNFLSQTDIQMRKGMLVYCVLLLLKDGKIYTSEIIRLLQNAQLIVVEGTLYPLLNRLAKDKILTYEWQESELGPPRKYYWLSDDGAKLLSELEASYKKLNNSVKSIEKGKN